MKRVNIVLVENVIRSQIDSLDKSHRRIHKARLSNTNEKRCLKGLIRR